MSATGSYAIEVAAAVRRRMLEPGLKLSGTASHRLVLRTRSPQGRQSFTIGFVPLREFCTLFPRIAIIGPRGAGRSTFLCELAQEACFQIDRDEAAAVPVFIEAAGVEPVALEDAIRVAEQRLAAADLARRSRPLQWLIDASDVSPTDAATHRWSAVGRLCERYAPSRCVVVSDRESALFLRDQYEFRVAEVEPFTPQEVQEFLALSGAGEAAAALVESVGLRRATRHARGLNWILDCFCKRGRAATNLLEVATHAAASEAAHTGAPRVESLVDASDSDLPGLMHAARACRECLGTPAAVGALGALANSTLGAELLVQMCGDESADALGGLVDQAIRDALVDPAQLLPLVAASAMLRYAERERRAWALAILKRRADAVVPLLTEATTSRVLDVARRLAAANALAIWGDSRMGTSPIENVAPFDAHEREFVGRYLITVRQFARFVASGGYAAPQWWSSEGRGFLQEANIEGPGNLEEQLEHPTRPIVHVSWFEAAAYCRWLSEQAAAKVSLVCLTQWQASARHPDGPFPWGAAEPTREIANYDQHIGHATPVGMYPRGSSPYGHCDLGGNVWEWCSDAEGLVATVTGGGWFSQGKYTRSDYSYQFDRRNRFHDLGFRVAVANSAPRDKKSQ